MKGVLTMDNKYVIEVLKKELESLKEGKLRLALLIETDSELAREMKEIDEKINEIEFHIDFV